MSLTHTRRMAHKDHTMANIINKQIVNSKLTSWAAQRHTQLEESPAIIQSAVYHGLLHGDFFKLRAYLATLGNTERGAILAAVLACSKLKKTTKRDNCNVPLFFERVGGNLSAISAEKAIAVVPDWRVAYEAKRAEQATARQAKAAAKAADKNADEAKKAAEKAAKGTGYVHFRTDILALAQKIRQAKSQKQTTATESALLDAYLAFVETATSKEAPKEAPKKTGTHN